MERSTEARVATLASVLRSAMDSKIHVHRHDSERGDVFVNDCTPVLNVLVTEVDPSCKLTSSADSTSCS